MPDLGPMQLGIILLIVVMIFGAGKLPQAASSLGKAIKEFKKSSSADDSEDVAVEATPRKRARVARVKPVPDIEAAPAATIETPAYSATPSAKTESVETPIHAA